MSLQSFVKTPTFEEYKERFKDHYKLERRKDGVVLAQAHTRGGSIQLSVENHRSLGQLFKAIGADPENEVMIFTGSGDDSMMDADPDGFKLEVEDLRHWSYEYAYKDGRINVSSLVNDLEIPTIGILNGPGFHSEIALMCDLTICSEDAVIYDLHYDIRVGAGRWHPFVFSGIAWREARRLRLVHRRGDRCRDNASIWHGQRDSAQEQID
jgi:hypothetical protein